MRGRGARLVCVVALLFLSLVWVWKTEIKPERVSLAIAAVVCAVTFIYALLTYEILIQNQVMAKAALESSLLMEKSLRFSHAPNLLYKTISTKDPTFGDHPESVVPVENADYKRALAEYVGESGLVEFVFAVITNQGQGSATNLKVQATYKVSDSSNPNPESTFSKIGTAQIVPPKSALALCIFISKVPTQGDRVNLVSAHISAGDFYRDAIKEGPQEVDVLVAEHHVEQANDGVVLVA